jgi:hypothetical protein
MSVLFIVSLIGGLVLGVFAMLHGVERRPPGATDLVDPPPPSELSARLNIPAIVGFLVAFGATGYPLHRTELGAPARLAIALVAGTLGALGAVALVARWAVPSARKDQVDERYLLMGHFARVTAPIGPDAPGTVTYEVEGRVLSARAASVDGARLDVGTDVVIERIEHGVAHVEAWSLVEKRI